MERKEGGDEGNGEEENGEWTRVMEKRKGGEEIHRGNQ